MKLIESIQYAPAEQIVRWINNGKNISVQPFTPWAGLPMHVASGEFTHSSKFDKSGTLHTVSISARLKEQILLPDLVIIKLNFCDGTDLIVGSPAIPVDLSYNNTLFANTLSIAHNTSEAPLPTAG